MNSQQMDDLFDILLKSGGDAGSKHGGGVQLLLLRVSSCFCCVSFQKSQA